MLEKELSLYSQYLKEKVIYCNCDNPYVSNFFKYFANNFKALGIKKVIATCYNNGKGAFKAILEHQVEDVEKWLNNDNVTLLDGDGDFASEECVKLLDETDIVVTNPPFSKFREFVALLMEQLKSVVTSVGSQTCRPRNVKSIWICLRDTALTNTRCTTTILQSMLTVCLTFLVTNGLK